MTTAAQAANHLNRELLAELRSAGCFRTAPVRSLLFGMFTLAGYSAAYLTLLSAPGATVRMSCLFALAFFNVQAGFLAHEAGHGALTRNRLLARLIGQVFNTLLTALCHSYFRHIHRLHHPHCNDRMRDPDLQSGFFGLYAQSAGDKHGFGKLVTRHQSVLIWILVWLQGLTLKIDSLRFLLRNPRVTRADQVMLALHVTLWLVPPVIALGFAHALANYAVMTLLIGGYTGTVFIVNHIGTRVIEPEDRLPHLLHELAVTRNLGSSRLDDIFFGGLNNHIEHHLFPSMPTARLPLARRITRAFCQRHDIAYREMSWLEAAREVSRHLKAMSALVPQP
jgi:fatty acid desaturase